RDDLVVLLLVGLLLRHGDEHPVAPDDRAGVADAPQRGLPEQVLPGPAVPAQGQVLLVAVAHARRAAPAGPVTGLAGVGGEQEGPGERNDGPGDEQAGLHDRISLVGEFAWLMAWPTRPPYPSRNR